MDAAVGRFYFESDLELRKKYLNNIFFLGTFLPFLIGLIAYVGFFLNSKFISVAFWPYISLTIFAIPLSGFSSLVSFYFRAKRDAYKFILFQLFQFIVQIGLVIVFVVIYKQGALGKIFGDLIAKGLILCLSALVFYKLLSFRFDGNYIKPVLKFALPVIPHALGWWAMNLSDRLVLQYYFSLSDVGVYSLAFNFGFIVAVFGEAFNNAFAPYLYEKAGNQSNFISIAVLIKYAIAFFAAISLGISFFSLEVINLIAGNSEYKLAINYIPVLSVSFFFINLYTLFTNQLFFIKKTYLLPIITFSIGIINLLFKICFGKYIGILGFTLSTAIFFLIYFLITYIVSNKLMKFPLERFIIFLTIFLTILSTTFIATFSELSLILRILIFILIFMILFVLNYRKGEFKLVNG